jgi:acyl-CoA thioesterase-1
MKIILFFSLAISVLLVSSCKTKEVKVACVGDSITEGAGIFWKSKDSYPIVLDKLLPENYSVLNCGKSAATILRDSDKPYWTCLEYSNIFAFRPDVIIIKLGTNDSKTQNWNEEEFYIDYQALIDTFKTIPGDPEIYLCSPVPAYNGAWNIRDSVILNGIIPAVRKIAERNALTLIDLYPVLDGAPELFPDGIHPNEEGAAIMAKTIAPYILKEKH